MSTDLDGKLNFETTYLLSQQLYLHMRTYGYVLVDLPLIEPADLFLIKAGDQIVDKLFTFDHRGTQLALRPEFTASAAYHYVTDYQDTIPVARWQFSGYTFIDDPFSSESSNQKYSIGAELIGMEGVFADAEIIGMAALGLVKQNVSDYQITLGHAGLLRRALNRFGLDNRTEHFLLSHLNDLKNPSRGRDYVIEQLEKLFLYVPRFSDAPPLYIKDNIQQTFDLMLETARDDTTTGGRTRDDISRRLFRKYRRSTERSQIIAAIDFLTEWGRVSAQPHEAFAAIARLLPNGDPVSHGILTEWQRLVDLLDVYGISTSHIVIQPNLARSWDYYSGIIFELGTRNGTHLGGGGRYDELGKLLGGKQGVSAVGFAYYIDELLSLISSANNLAIKPINLIASYTSVFDATRWANMLRRRNFDTQVLLANHGYSPSGILLLLAQDDGTVRFNEQVYRFDDIDALAMELKQSR